MCYYERTSAERVLAIGCGGREQTADGGGAAVLPTDQPGLELGLTPCILSIITLINTEKYD